MVKQFTRNFRELARLLPGIGDTTPSRVDTTVYLTKNILRPSVLHDVRFQSNAQGTGTGGGGDVVLTHPEPAAGMLWLPVHWALQYDSAVTLRAQLELGVTTSALDPWGRWSDVLLEFGTIEVGNSKWLTAYAFPLPRGHFYAVRFLGTGAAQNVRSRIFFHEVPGELLEFQPTPVSNFAYTAAV